MKRASLAAVATLLTAGIAYADPQADIARDFTAFRQNALDMVMKQDFDGAKNLYEKTVDTSFKGTHNMVLSISPSAGETDVGAAMGKPGAVVLTGPEISLSFGIATTRDGYMNLIGGLARTAGNPNNADAVIALPALTKNTQVTPAVQSVTVAADGATATVKNNLTGKVDAEGLMKELGYPGLPPMLTGMEVTLSLDCDTTVKLGTAGAFTITGETCSGHLQAVGTTRLPGAAPQP